MQFVTIMSGFLLFAFQFVMFSGHLLLLRINAQLLSINLQVNTRYTLRAFPELPMIIKLRNGREKKHEECESGLFDKHFVARLFWIHTTISLFFQAYFSSMA